MTTVDMETAVQGQNTTWPVQFGESDQTRIGQRRGNIVIALKEGANRCNLIAQRHGHLYHASLDQGQRFCRIKPCARKQETRFGNDRFAAQKRAGMPGELGLCPLMMAIVSAVQCNPGSRIQYQIHGSDAPE